MSQKIVLIASVLLGFVFAASSEQHFEHQPLYERYKKEVKAFEYLKTIVCEADRSQLNVVHVELLKFDQELFDESITDARASALSFLLNRIERFTNKLTHQYGGGARDRSKTLP